MLAYTICWSGRSRAGAGPVRAVVRWSCRWLAVIAAGLVVSTAGWAQVRGTVTDRAMEPLSGVTVELWGENGRIAAGVTDGNGTFVFPERQAELATGLTLARLGYQPLMVTLAPGDSLLRLRLEVQPVALPELTVVASGTACPNSEEARARDLWQTVRRQYATTTAARGMYIRSRVGEERLVPAERVGWIEEKHLRGRAHRRVGALEEPSLDRFLDVDTRIRADGYAIPRERNEASWQFINLSGMHAHHFASDVFGERHTLSIMDEDVHGVVIAFCPVRTDQPSIEGTLVVSRDSAFVSAKWRYRTPRQRQDAGGEVTFLPHWSRREALPHLLAGRGLFWRQDPNRTDRYFHRVQVFTEWVISDTGEMPDTIGAR